MVAERILDAARRWGLGTVKGRVRIRGEERAGVVEMDGQMVEVFGEKPSKVARWQK